MLLAGFWKNGWLVGSLVSRICRVSQSVSVRAINIDRRRRREVETPQVTALSGMAHRWYQNMWRLKERAARDASEPS